MNPSLSLRYKAMRVQRVGRVLHLASPGPGWSIRCQYSEQDIPYVLGNPGKSPNVANRLHWSIAEVCVINRNGSIRFVLVNHKLLKTHTWQIHTIAYCWKTNGFIIGDKWSLNFGSCVSWRSWHSWRGLRSRLLSRWVDLQNDDRVGGYGPDKRVDEGEVEGEEVAGSDGELPAGHELGESVQEFFTGWIYK